MTRSHLASGIWAFAVALAFAMPARAQVVTGMPPFASVSGGSFDKINESNLNVFFSIGVVKKPGRGMPFDYSIGYNNSVWSRWDAVGNLAWTPDPNWGWGGVTSADTGSMAYTTYQGKCYYPQNPSGHWYFWYIYDFTSYYDPNGTPHPFNQMLTTWTSSIPCGSSGGYPQSYTGTLTDGSGYTIAVDNAPSATIYTPSGLTVTPPLNAGTGAGSIVDANTNSLSTNGTTFTDTLGMTALSVSNSTYTYTGPSGSEHYTVNYTQYTVRTNFGCSGISEYGPTSNSLASSVSLPDGTSYGFTYEPTPGYPGDVTGRIASVTLPTGGTTTYSYSGGNNGINCIDASTPTLTRTTPDGTWTYTQTKGSSGSTTNITAPPDPQGNQAYTTINFQGLYETERQIYATNGGVELRDVTTCYNNSPSSCTRGSSNSTGVGEPITQRVILTTPYSNGSAGSPAQVVQTYDGTYTLPLETDEYDFGGSTPIRKTIVSYNDTSCGVTNANVVNLPCKVQVEDANSAVKAETDYIYDVNGNLQTQTVSTGGSPATVSRAFGYGSYGVLTSATDFNSHSTTYSNFTCANAFPQTITSGGLTTYQTWDCNGGVVTSVTDPNSQPTSFSYDFAWRLQQTSLPGGGQTTVSYIDIANSFSVVTNRLVSSGVHHQTTQSLDSQGRVSHSQDNSAGSTVDTTYDALGRVHSVSNPHGTTGGPSDGTTYYSYDALGRPANVSPAHAILYPDGNYTTISYSGNCVTAADPAGKARTTCTDGLGRISSVTEDPGGLGYVTNYSYDALNNLTGVSQSGQTPCGTLSRSYAYDMLSRLTSACTPESGTTYFYYTTSGGAPCSGDPNAACRRTDARSTTTTYTYDALNRLTSKTYSDSTPAANFFYDESSAAGISIYQTKGRMSHWTTTANGSTLSMGIYSYYATGLPQDYWQCTGADCGSPPAAYYNYDLAGDLIGAYPPQMPFQLGLAYDSAQRLTGVTQNTGSWIDPTRPATLANFPAYTPFGAVDTLTDGCVGTGCSTPYQEKYGYNNRLQPVLVQVGTTASPNYVSCDAYYYYSGFSPPPAGSCPATAPTSGTGNNSNPMGWSHWDLGGGGSGVNNTTNYAYDSLNRLTQATMASHYTQNYNYDRYGNMVCSGNYCNITVAFDSATNHITTSGFTYDAAGNLTKDGTGLGTHTFQWDAEGRMVSVDGVAGQSCQSSWTDCFTYNALGQRVQKHVGSPASDTYYYYDAFGNLAMTKGASQVNEYLFPGNFGKYYWTGSVWETDYTHKNTLGSTQVVTRADGTCAEAEVFYPFGGKRWRGCNGTQDVRFTGMQERDLETETWQDTLDPTPNRTYTSGLGRWFSPDPLAGDITNPQSLNRYAYVLNNPTTLNDPSGLGDCPPGTHQIGPGQCESDFTGADQLALVGPGWDPFQLQEIPVVAYGIGWIPVQGSAMPGPSFFASVGDASYFATTSLILSAYWGYTSLGYIGDAFVLLGASTSAATGPTPMPPNQRTQPQSVTKPPGPDKWWPSTDPSSCSVYAPGSLPGFVCRQFPSGPRANSIRGCLQQFYIPGSGYIPFATIANPNLNSLVPVDQRVGFGEHAYCIPEGTLNP